MKPESELNIRPFSESDRPSVIDLWHRAGLVVPWNDPDKDIDRKLMVQPELFLVVELNGKIIGTLMAGYGGHRGLVNYLAVDEEFRRKGIGHLMMEKVEKELIRLGCPKINIQVRGSNTDLIAFYKSIGYREDDVLSLGKRFIPDD